MRILVIGAGATGGYFGGRMLQAGGDVTFLVREKRAALLAEQGLIIKSPLGDVTLPNPPTVTAGNIKAPYDIILLSAKAYDLDDAIASFAPAVGPDTTIIPVLNGMKHLDVLDAKFGKARVMGGQCAIAAQLDDKGVIHHFVPMLSMTFGEREGGISERARTIAAALKGETFAATASDNIMQEMWEKWVFLATLAGATCMMRAPVGKIVSAPGGEDFVRGVRDEIASIATAAGHEPRAAFLERTGGMLFDKNSALTASMLRDIQGKSRIEADHIIGDLIVRAEAAAIDVPLLRVIYTRLKAYEAQRG
ncbi:2-dehydropantoate 2-reductase [Afipia sp. TerB]